MAAHWFSDLELEEPSFPHQWQGDWSNQFTQQQIAVAFGQNQNLELRQLVSAGDNINTTLINCTNTNISENPENIRNTTRWVSGIIGQMPCSQTTLSFGAQDASVEHAVLYRGVTKDMKQPKKEVDIALPGNIGNAGCNNKRRYDEMVAGEVLRKCGNDTGIIYWQREREEHTLAERMRREKLSQMFVALSKIVPDLKKMDRASVLGDAIKYLKQLQDKLQELEARAIKRTFESAVLVKKSHLPSDKDDYHDDDDGDNSSPCDENLINKGSILKGLPEIEAMMSEQTVIIKIHCENLKGALVKVLAEIEALGLSITSTNVMPFAGSSLDITAVAQVEDNSVSVKDVVKKLNQAFKQFI